MTSSSIYIMSLDTSSTSVMLPSVGKDNILITSALPYVNNVPHLGNIIGSVLSADVFARYCRGRGMNTLYVCGTDEYGTTTEAKALTENCTPQELCDKFHMIHAGVYKWFNISFDIFGRTTTELQTQITQEIFLQLHQNDLLEERITTQLFCPQHNSFLADRFVEGECPMCGFVDARGDQCDSCGQLLDSLDLKLPRCKIDGASPITKETKHIFMKLNALQTDIDDFYRQSSLDGAWSNVSKGITSAWLKNGLKSRSITRDMRWGTKIPLPGYEEKVIYPWFDACIGYVSITANYTPEWRQWWHNPEEVKLYQFVGKDNVVFHSVIFPGTQIGTRQKWTKVHHLSATEYLTYEGGKFSKSRSIGVFGDSAAKTGVPADVWRYYLLSHRPETSDSEFNWDAFISSNNSLLKNLGNFVSRIIKFVNSKIYQNVVPDYTQDEDESYRTFKVDINILLTQYIKELDAVKLRSALTTVMHISSRGNLFLQSSNLSNSLAATEPAGCAAVVGLAINLVHLLASIVAPYMPDTAKSMNVQLQAEPVAIPDRWTADTIKPSHEIGKAVYLFSTIPADKGPIWRKEFGSEEADMVKEETLSKKAKKKAKTKAGGVLKDDTKPQIA